MRGEDILFPSLDGLLGSPHDRILYTYMCQQDLEACYMFLSEIYKYKACSPEKQYEQVSINLFVKFTRRLISAFVLS